MFIRNARALIGRKFSENVCVRAAGGRIEQIGQGIGARGGEEVIDAEGMTLAPGFIDIHIHGYGGHDTMNGRAAVEHMAKKLVRHGVTGFLPTTMAAAIEDTREALAAVQEVRGRAPAGARVLGCHLEGPFLNPIRKGAQPAQFIIPPSMENYRKITEGLEQTVRLMTIAPEMDGAEDLIRALKGEMALSAGHTDASAEAMTRAADAGISQVTHLFNGMNPFSHRAPGVPGAALTDGRIAVQMIADLLHLHPAALRLAWLAKRAEGCVLITDAMEATGMPDGQYRLGANDVTVKNREARLADGTIAGSTLTMERAVRNMIRAAGIPEEDALVMASETPAERIRETERGRIEEGFHADLVLLDRDYEVAFTLVAGEVAYRRG